MNAINPIAIESAKPIEADNVNVPLRVEYAGHAVVNREDLAIAVKALKGVTERRNTIPILSNVKLISASSAALAIIATDLDMEVTISIPAAIDAAFGVTLPAGMLETLIAKAPKSEMVAIESRGERAGAKGEFDSVDAAIIDFERARYTLHALPINDFPILTKTDATHRFEISGKVFREMLANVEGAVSTEETRYYLNGIYFHCDEGKLIAVATDGHRLYKQEIDAPDGAAGMPGMILPRKAVAYLLRTMKGKEAPETVSIGVNGTRATFEYGPLHIHTKLVDGTFPDYNRVIPRNNEKIAVLNVSAFKESLDAVCVISSERGRAFSMTLDNGACRLDVNNPDSGAASSAFGCSFIDHNSDEMPFLRIGFNAGYVSEILSNIEAAEIQMVFNDPGAPVLIQDEGRDGWLGVLMPMRV